MAKKIVHSPGIGIHTTIIEKMPIDIEKSKKDTMKIVYKCNKCGMIKKNKASDDDNFDLILEIMSKGEKI